MKKIFTLFFAILCFTNASAVDFKVNGIFYSYDSEKKNAIVVAGDDPYSGNITIPKSVTVQGKTLPVTQIGEEAFSGCEQLLTINLPNSITKINKMAFYECTSLKNLTLPEGVTDIRDWAFFGCNSIGPSITIPASVTYIGNATFAECGSLKEFVVDSKNKFFKTQDGILCFANSVVCYPKGKGGTSYQVPSNITSIGVYAFYGCNSITSVKFHKNVSLISSWAFQNCKGLKNLVLPDSVTYIGWFAFAGCSNIGPSVTIPAYLDLIGRGAFADCGALKEFIVHPKNRWMCSDDGALVDKGLKRFLCYPKGKSGTSYRLPNGLETIFEYAFSKCDGLTEIVIPNSYKKINEGAFEGCDGLKSVTIGSGMKMIGERAFYRCYINTLKCLATTPPSIQENTFYDYNAQIYVPKGSKDAYTSDTYWKRFFKINELPEIKGDVNGDGEVNASDITMLINVILGTEQPDNKNACDINGDSIVNTSDITTLINILLK